MNELFFDIESVPDQKPGWLDRAKKKVSPPANYKKPETIEKWWKEEGAAKIDQAHRDTALDGAYGEIVSIAWQVNDGEIHCITREADHSEPALLNDFFDELIEEIEPQRLTKWIAHNSDFDLWFLQQRCWVNNIKSPIRIPVDVRPGSELVADPMRMFRGYYSRKFISQDELYRILGGKPYEDDIDGSQVYDLWCQEQYDIIRDYNIRDVEKLVYTYRRLS